MMQSVQGTFDHSIHYNFCSVAVRLIINWQHCAMDTNRKQIAILDFGSQYSHLIARRLRELNIFCELYSCLVNVDELNKHNIIGIVLSGGPSSVYDPGTDPH